MEALIQKIQKLDKEIEVALKQFNETSDIAVQSELNYIIWDKENMKSMLSTKLQIMQIRQSLESKSEFR